MRYYFLALYLIVVAVHLYTCVRTGQHTLRKITKCLLMPLLALCYRLFAVNFSIFVFVALIFSFFGDAFLLAPRWNWSFGAGLGAFSVGHVLYIIHMIGTLPDAPTWYMLVLLALICCMLSLIALRYLWDGLPPVLRAPCIFYMLDISFMTCCTFLFAFSGLSVFAPLAAFGGVLFVVSDSVLSIDTFKKPVSHRHIIVMGTYIAAQTLLTLAFTLS